MKYSLIICILTFTQKKQPHQTNKKMSSDKDQVVDHQILDYASLSPEDKEYVDRVSKFNTDTSEMMRIILDDKNFMLNEARKQIGQIYYKFLESVCLTSNLHDIICSDLFRSFSNHLYYYCDQHGTNPNIGGSNILFSFYLLLHNNDIFSTKEGKRTKAFLILNILHEEEGCFFPKDTSQEVITLSCSPIISVILMKLFYDSLPFDKYGCAVENMRSGIVLLESEHKKLDILRKTTFQSRTGLYSSNPFDREVDIIMIVLFLQLIQRKNINTCGTCDENFTTIRLYEDLSRYSKWVFC